MKIIALHIYGFGRFQNQVIDMLSPNLQIIFGENEAGKSTLMSFIRMILFGFPTRQQSENRFEPKLGTAYGGKIILNTNAFGIVEIERVKGKASGDVTIYFEDGTTATEEVISKILGGLERSLFMGIFSFGIKDLQGIEQISASELGSYLYGIGMSGKTSITEYDKKLNKLQTELFKPQGKKPQINEKILQIYKLEENVLRWTNKLSHYEEKHTEKNKVEQKQNRLEREKETLKQQERMLEKAKLLEPLLSQKNHLVNQLKNIGEMCFPEEGLKQLETIKTGIKLLKEKEIELEKKIEQNQNKLEERSYNSMVIDNEHELQRLQTGISLYNQCKEEEGLLKNEINFIEKEIELVLDQLGPNWKKENIQVANVSFAAKEALKEILQKEGQVKQKLDYLNKLLEKKQAILGEAENHLNVLNVQVLTEKERAELEGRYKAETAQKEKEQFENLLTKMKKNDNPFFYLVFSIMLLVTFLWIGIIHEDWLSVSMIIGLSSILVIFRYIKLRKKETSFYAKFKGEQDENQKDKDFLISSIEEQLKIDDDIRKQLQLQRIRVSEDERAYVDIVEQIEQCELESYQLQESLLKWGKLYQIELSESTSIANDVIQTIEKGKSLIKNLEAAKAKYKDIEQKLIKFELKTKRIGQCFHVNSSESMEAMIHLMMQKLENEKNQKRLSVTLMEQINQLVNELEIIREKIEYYNREKLNLFRSVEVDDEEQFLYKGKVNLEKQKLEKEIFLLETQIQSTINGDIEYLNTINSFINNISSIDEQLDMLEQKKKDIQQNESLLRKKIAELTQDMVFLEGEKSYSELVQEFELEKQELKRLVKKWAIYRTARFLIEKAKEIYENERQPVVILRAGKYFTEMTNGKYIKLFAPVGEETFVVERKDGVRFFPEELSQGTKEQLYLSLRFALATAFRGPFPYPIIMDDILVNFDDSRKKNVAKVVQSLANEHQVILFTCHSYALRLFEKAPVKQL